MHTCYTIKFQAYDTTLLLYLTVALLLERHADRCAMDVDKEQWTCALSPIRPRLRSQRIILFTNVWMHDNTQSCR